MIYYQGHVCVFAQVRADKSINHDALIMRISDIAKGFFLPSGLSNIRYIEIENMPVDGRHNSKIDRPLLREYLAKNKLNNNQLLTL